MSSADQSMVMVTFELWLPTNLGSESHSTRNSFDVPQKKNSMTSNLDMKRHCDTGLGPTRSPSSTILIKTFCPRKKLKLKLKLKVEG